MATNANTQSWQASLARSAVCRASRLLFFGFSGWLWFLSSDDSAWRTDSLVAVLALAAVVGITWFLSRALVNRRWRAALDRYAEKQQPQKFPLRRRQRG